jgi:hypothetical protein
VRTGHPILRRFSYLVVVKSDVESWKQTCEWLTTNHGISGTNWHGIARGIISCKSADLAAEVALLFS